MDWSGDKQPDPEREHLRRENCVRGAADLRIVFVDERGRGVIGINEDANRLLWQSALDTDARIMIDNGALQPIEGRVSVRRAVAGAARKARPGLPHRCYRTDEDAARGNRGFTVLPDMYWRST